MVSVSSPVVMIRSQEEYLRLGREIVDSIKKEVTCPHDIVDQNLISDHLSAVDNYEKLGDRYLQNLSLEIRLDDARAACTMAAKQIFGEAKGIVVDLAVTKFGIGNCSEMASRVVLECIRQRIPAKIVQSVAPLFKETHAFVVFNPDNEEIVTGKNPLEAFARSKTGVITDGYFNLVRPVSHLKGTAFETYFLRSKIDKIYNCQMVQTREEAEIKSIEESITEVYEVAKAMIKDPKWVSPAATQMKEDVYRGYRKEQIQELLPGLVWKEMRNGTLWVRTDLSSAQEICKAINAKFRIALKPQKVQSSEDHVVLIDRATLLSMRAQNTPSLPDQDQKVAE
jgi:uncharacterized protein (UPF0335 family)